MTQPTDYQIELQRIDRALTEHQKFAVVAQADNHHLALYAYYLYQRAALTGSLDELEAAESAIDGAIRATHWPGDLYLLKANLAFKLHRLADVHLNLEAVPSVLESTKGKVLRADLAFQEGRYAEAEGGYRDVIREERTWDSLARLAYLEAKIGKVTRAEQRFVEAQEELTAKEMRSYAWLELQRGVLDLARGRFEEAGTHYQRAGQAYSGYWLVDEHVAELLAAQGKFREAIARYEDVVGRAPKPELQQALGEIYLLMGDPDRARAWNEKALTAYLESARRGGVHYYHHLADFYSDADPDGAQAVKWAQKDFEVRQNFSTQAALAWALHRHGRLPEAADMSEKATSSGVKDAHVFSQAAAIHLAAGQTDVANQYATMAAQLNPRHHTFHVHR